MSIQKEFFGKTPQGEEVYTYRMKNAQGMEALVSSYGAVLVSLLVPDQEGKKEDVVLGFDRLEEYFDNGPSFGATIGRVANRIGKARFTLHEKEYQLDQNDGENCLHSGNQGYLNRVWEAQTEESELGDEVTFSLDSPEGDQGFPGHLQVSVTMILTPDNSLILRYHGICDQDTIINLTNHSYFNLAGHHSGSALDQQVWIDADAFTITDQGSIPTGELGPVEGTPMDFRTRKPIGQEIDAAFTQLQWAGGYDHNWVLNTKPGEVSLAASLWDPKSKRLMEVYTDLPGMQFYAGNYLDGTRVGKGGAVYNKRNGVCFETQMFPNAINIPSFAQPVLRQGEEYQTETIYQFKIKES